MAKRIVDKGKTAKALRKLRKAVERASGEGGPGLTTWEKDFVEGVSGRLEKYGSAFRDPGKGRLEEALSQRQSQVVRVIDKKARKTKVGAAETDGGSPDGKSPPRVGLQRKTPMRAKAKPGWKPRVRDINGDLEQALEPPLARPRRQSAAEKRASLRVIPGGRGS